MALELIGNASTRISCLRRKKAVNKTLLPLYGWMRIFRKQPHLYLEQNLPNTPRTMWTRLGASPEIHSRPEVIVFSDCPPPTVGGIQPRKGEERRLKLQPDQQPRLVQETFPGSERIPAKQTIGMNISCIQRNLVNRTLKQSIVDMGVVPMNTSQSLAGIKATSCKQLERCHKRSVGHGYCPGLPHRAGVKATPSQQPPYYNQEQNNLITEEIR